MKKLQTPNLDDDERGPIVSSSNLFIKEWRADSGKLRTKCKLNTETNRNSNIKKVIKEFLDVSRAEIH